MSQHQPGLPWPERETMWGAALSAATPAGADRGHGSGEALSEAEIELVLVEPVDLIQSGQLGGDLLAELLLVVHGTVLVGIVEEVARR